MIDTRTPDTPYQSPPTAPVPGSAFDYSCDCTDPVCLHHQSLYDRLMDSNFTEALDGATLPGFQATVEDDMAGRFIVWHPVIGGTEKRFGATEVYATPGWEGATGISVCIHGGDRVWTDHIDVTWTDDGVQNAHIYLAAMRGWLLQLPRIYGRWDGMADRDFEGTVIDWVEEFHDTDLFDTECAFEPCGGTVEGFHHFFTAIERLDSVDWIADNCCIRGIPHPPVGDDDGE